MNFGVNLDSTIICDGEYGRKQWISRAIARAAVSNAGPVAQSRPRRPPPPPDPAALGLSGPNEEASSSNPGPMTLVLAPLLFRGTPADADVAHACPLRHGLGGSGLRSRDVGTPALAVTPVDGQSRPLRQGLGGSGLRFLDVGTPALAVTPVDGQSRPLRQGLGGSGSFFFATTALLFGTTPGESALTSRLALTLAVLPADEAGRPGCALKGRLPDGGRGASSRFKEKIGGGVSPLAIQQASQSI